jgi:transcriptional regulator with XRE-family HTH domain
MSGLNKRGRDPLDDHIAARLVMLRRARGLSQLALGDAIGVSFQQIQKYENAQNRIAASRLLRIARALDCKIADFIPEEHR